MDFGTNWQPVVQEVEACFDGCLAWNMRGLLGTSHGGEVTRPQLERGYNGSDNGPKMNNIEYPWGDLYFMYCRCHQMIIQIHAQCSETNQDLYL